MNTVIERITSIAREGNDLKYNGRIAHSDMPALAIGKVYELHIVTYTNKIAAATLLDGVYTEIIKVTRIDWALEELKLTTSEMLKFSGGDRLSAVHGSAITKPGTYKIMYSWVGAHAIPHLTAVLVYGDNPAQVVPAAPVVAAPAVAAPVVAAPAVAAPAAPVTTAGPFSCKCSTTAPH